jgi:hypothetical protein
MTEPSDDIGDYSWMFYGAKKIGKTTLASQFPDALFFMFEAGAKALRTYRIDVHGWQNAVDAVGELEQQKKAGKLRFKTIIIDTGFEAYKKCMEKVCDDLGIEYPRDNNFGKDWTKISDEFRIFHNRLLALDLGLVVLCHETMREAQTYSGNKYSMIVPKLSNAADDFYRAAIDNVCWYHYRNKERYLLIRGNDYAMAGVAFDVEEHFTSKNGSVHAVPMGTTGKEAYKNLLRAFNNQQEVTYKEESNQMADKAVKESVRAELVKEQKRQQSEARKSR